MIDYNLFREGYWSALLMELVLLLRVLGLLWVYSIKLETFLNHGDVVCSLGIHTFIAACTIGAEQRVTAILCWNDKGNLLLWLGNHIFLVDHEPHRRSQRRSLARLNLAAILDGRGRLGYPVEGHRQLPLHEPSALAVRLH